MANSNFSRRHFIGAVAGAAATANLHPLQSFANSKTDEKKAPAGPIKIICTSNFSAKEQEKIKSVSKNYVFPNQFSQFLLQQALKNVENT